ncbi:SIMPL domain-containing protein [Candidatus Peregrinibacteria bacterium]|jgi:uncharacterized protein|nr:SIMPL domain-containing protein [Candidatus Peregrinibacteria bacterium]MBT5468521.1 SIMPL domain-containing protein [Candidatus Peregrinibacteria bacterium]MBT7337757.1 SIMPL domain-containing protein [Candidatus Peregrinibacteria bacterium]
MDEKAIYLKPPLWLPIAVALVAGSLYVAGKYVETRHMDNFTINVQGRGEIMAVPDIATLNFGVQTGRQKTADSAMTILTEKMTEVMKALTAAGVEEKDIRTQYLSLNPSYDWNDGRRVDEGFEANQSLVVKVRDLEKISEVLDAGVKSGANQAGSVNFTIDDPENLKAEARAKAIASAQEKAKLLADDLGVNLGKMQGFWEEQGGYAQPMMLRAESMDMKGGVGGGGMAPPLPAGEQEVVVTVNLTYQLR